MTQHRIEIFRRAGGRYSWRQVELEGAERRVQAHSPHEYLSPGAVHEALKQLQGAEIIESEAVSEPFPIPETEFELLKAVTPLPVDARPSTPEPKAKRRRWPRRATTPPSPRRRSDRWHRQPTERAGGAAPAGHRGAAASRPRRPSGDAAAKKPVAKAAPKAAAKKPVAEAAPKAAAKAKPPAKPTAE